MEVWQALLLGIVQGLAEFLPISSSGHLSILQMLFGMEEAPLTLSILLHLGTLLAVFVVYWKRIWHMACHPFRSDFKWLVVATIPAVLAALFLDDAIDELFTGKYLGFCFLLTTLALLMGEWSHKLVQNKHKRVRAVDAIVMGCMQALAIAPGLSRSGSTIAGGLCVGLTRKRAADFSFLMSIPAILGSAMLDTLDIFSAAQANGVSFGTQLSNLVSELGGAAPIVVGVAAAALSGFLAIRFMLMLVKRIGFGGFATYTGLVGAFLIIKQFLF